ncbi:MAG: S46 family peptidase, partial [Bacteroidales bacterium]|nr:S46 family peptidase [Bacteroidales bacterium]
MKKMIFMMAALFLAGSKPLIADEGMWLLTLLEELNINRMTSMGLKLSAEDIYSINQSSLKDAVVIFGGGCTGELVS